jgi:hypothetical protein
MQQSPVHTDVVADDDRSVEHCSEARLDLGQRRRGGQHAVDQPG